MLISIVVYYRQRIEFVRHELYKSGRQEQYCSDDALVGVPSLNSMRLHFPIFQFKEAIFS